MKQLLMILASLSLLIFNFQANALGKKKSKPMQTVDYVEPGLFVGRWYQISRNRLIFEPKVCDCAQQTLKVIAPNTLSVYNSCNQGSPEGKLRSISGEATNVDTKTNAKFSIDFGLPWKGKYWIIGLAGDYHWAVVSDPKRRSLYILSKTPTLSDESYKDAIAVAQTQISTKKLLRTSHEGCSYPEM